MEKKIDKLSEDAVWGKLIPTDSRYLGIDLKLKDTVIWSIVKHSSSRKEQWCKITRIVDLVSAMIQNKSSKAILVDKTVVHDAHCALIRSGSAISLGPRDEGFLEYRFEIMPTEEPRTRIQFSLDVKHARCSICLDIWHDAVTAAPCLHNFCDGCFSKWQRETQETRPDTLCPECRADVVFVGRNHFLQRIEEEILQAEPWLSIRLNEELELADSHTSINSSSLVLNNPGSSQRREHSTSEVASGWEPLCPQCGYEAGGFQCTEATTHLQCCKCKLWMPLRQDMDIQQHCLGCNSVFCAAYWVSQGLDGSCAAHTFEPIEEHRITSIPEGAHEGNLYEKYITASCFERMRTSLQQVVSDYIVHFNENEIDRTLLQLDNAESITHRTYTCRDCYEKFVSFLLYSYRTTVTLDVLPPEAVERRDCRFGYACLRQHVDENHARRKNHVCSPLEEP